MKRFAGVWIMLAGLLAASPALAHHLNGYVRCDSNGNGSLDGDDLPIVGAIVNVTNTAGTFTASGTTDSNGFYDIALRSDAADYYVATLDPASLPADATVVIPSGGIFSFDSFSTSETREDWLVSSATCQAGNCWLTGGGTVWDKLLNQFVATKDPKLSFGGNVHPGCSPTSGAGGDWNVVDRGRRLHFHGTDIPTVSCGNVPGIPPGSNSPKTPFNYIEFQGTGWLHGIQGNKTSYDLVYFFARAEDRNEPGSRGANDGALIDRLFLRVFLDPNNPIGSTVLLLDTDGDPSTVDPTPITTGNLQIHISSCDNPPLQ
ncbi:MAG TPA: SdrD B-like domain-containing protein [Candidatus Polarisedimenticolaceae bacterium]|nr:SdrD B-like domain-containing protein [Candidatus Polarisedimenticolaceae bacterium]